MPPRLQNTQSEKVLASFPSLSIDAAPQSQNGLGNQALKEMEALATKLLKMEERLTALQENKLPAPALPQRSIEDIESEIKKLESTSKGKQHSLDQTQKALNSSTIKMEELQAKLAKKEKQLEKLEETINKKNADQSIANSHRKKFELQLAQNQSTPTVAIDQTRLNTLDTQIAQSKNLIAKKRDQLEKEDKDLAKLNQYHAELEDIIQRITKAVENTVNKANLSTFVNPIKIKNSAKEILASQNVNPMLAIPELRDNPHRPDDAKIFTQFVEKSLLSTRKSDGTFERKCKPGIVTSNQGYFQQVKFMTCFMANEKCHKDLMESQGKKTLELTRLYSANVMPGAVAPQWEDVIRIVEPAYDEFRSSFFSDFEKLSSAKERNAKVKLSGSGQSHIKGKELDLLLTQYTVLKEFIESNEENFRQGFIEAAAHDFGRFEENLSEHKNKIREIRHASKNLPGEIEKATNQKTSTQKLISMAYEKMKALEQEKAALISTASRNSAPTQQTENTTSFFHTTQEGKSPEDQRLKINREISNLIEQSKEITGEYERASREYLSAQNNLDQTTTEIENLREQLSTFKSQKQDAWQQHRADIKDRNQQINSLKQDINSIRNDIENHPLLKKLITKDAFERVLARHLDQKESEMEQRSKITGRTATYQSLGHLLQALVRISQSVHERFPFVAQATSETEFNQALKKSPMEDRLFNHSKVIGHGMRTGTYANNSVSSQTSCYSIAWDKGQQRAVISHLYPWISPA